MNINVSEFMDHLKENNLLIVSRSDYENGENVANAKLLKKQKSLLNKPAVTPYEMVKYKLTHYNSITGIKASQLFKPGEMYHNSKGKLMVVTSAVKRIRTNKHL
ncbi:hypothetical protein ACFQ5N_02365 [Lutibacter holmesii]|uniref:Uncharacterized protein n=1 Tax=Lutibacter holmesii TaxID=1137985 RepID=A0ABW3WKD5_9FLAO